MPQESIRVYFTMVDGASQVMATIGDQTRALEKETQLLQQTQQGLSKANRELLRTQSELQSQLKSASRTVNEAQKAFDEYGDEVSKLKLDAAIDNQAELRGELEKVNSQLKSNAKSYKEYESAVKQSALSWQSGP